MEHERCPQNYAEWEEVARSSPTLSFEVPAKQEQHASEEAIEGRASQHHDLLVEKTKTAGLVRSSKSEGCSPESEKSGGRGLWRMTHQPDKRR
jgi:hypothetical protein